MLSPAASKPASGSRRLNRELIRDALRNIFALLLGFLVVSSRNPESAAHHGVASGNGNLVGERGTTAHRVQHLRILWLYWSHHRPLTALVTYLQRALPLSARWVPFSETTPPCPSTGRPVEHSKPSLNPFRALYERLRNMAQLAWAVPTIQV